MTALIKWLVTFLKIALAVEAVLLCLMVLMATGDRRGGEGPEDYLIAAGYLLAGIILCLLLIIKRGNISYNMFKALTAVYTIVFVLPALVLCVFIYWLMGQC